MSDFGYRQNLSNNLQQYLVGMYLCARNRVPALCLLRCRQSLRSFRNECRYSLHVTSHQVEDWVAEQLSFGRFCVNDHGFPPDGIHVLGVAVLENHALASDSVPRLWDAKSLWIPDRQDLAWQYIDVQQ